MLGAVSFRRYRSDSNLDLIRLKPPLVLEYPESVLDMDDVFLKRNINCYGHYFEYR